MDRCRLTGLALGVALLAACANQTPRSQPEAASGFRAGLDTVTASRHMAAAANPLAAEAGRQILRRGGSAVDAAIAMQMVLTLVEPQSSGLGGGAFLMHWDGRRVQAFDGRETAPAAVGENLFIVDGKPMAFYDAAVGGRAVGVPGAVRMLEMAHRQHGRLPWRDLFAPAIQLADTGFAVSPRLYALLASEKFLVRDPPAAAYFYNSDGSPRAIGTVLKNPALSTTLRAIAQSGSDALHDGTIGAAIVRKVREHSTNPGLMTDGDLRSYQAKERVPVCFDYRVWKICGMPPPSSGGIAIAQMLGILSTRSMAAYRPIGSATEREPTVEAVHLFSEAGRLAFADRARYVADSDFVAVDVAALIDPVYLRARASLIGERSMGSAKPGDLKASVALADDESPYRVATSHISVVDDFGNVVAMTTSIEDQFGSRQMVAGFLLNNELTDFSFAPSAGGQPIANRVQPGKRPRSSMAPTLVFDRASGVLMASIGSPGGSFIIGYVAKTLFGILDWDLDIQQAISLPNFGSQNGPTDLEQDRVTAQLIDGLKARGHDVRTIPMTSGIQGIVRVRRADGQSVWAGGADPRREGVALGD